MKRIILIAALSFVSIFFYAGATDVRGSVKDSLSLAGEPGAVLQFYKLPDMSKAVAFCVTDADGKFSQELSLEGEYRVVFTSLGRKTVSRDFVISGQQTLELEDILAQDDAETLKEASVTALHKLVKMEVDKMTYKVEDDVDSKSFTLLDMLRKVPMVTVDAQDNITVNGSSNFQVLVDGKPNVMISSNPSMVFKSMPASFVKSIEVITNPGVKYDAEGVGGVLNIVTNRAAMGAAGGASAMDGYNATLGGAASTMGFNGRAFVNGQQGKFSYSANITYSRTSLDGISSDMTREQLNEAGDVVSILKSSTRASQTAPALIGGFNLGYEIDSLRLVTAAVSVSSIRSEQSMVNSFSYSLTGVPAFGYESDARTLTGMNNYTASVDYQRSFTGNPGRSLVISYQFSGAPVKTQDENKYSAPAIPGFDMASRCSDGQMNTVQNTVQVDYTSPVNEMISMNAGAKYINRRSSSRQSLFLEDGGVMVRNDAGSVDYLNTNDIAALYGEAAYKKESLSVKAGLRYEHTFVGVENRDGSSPDFSLDYGNLVPAASVQYNIGMLQNVGLSYNMRISRPGISYLNPFVDISDPTARSYGNPDLETERAHNVSLSYNFMSPVFIVSASLRESYCGNAIGSYSYYDAGGLLNTTYTNNTTNSTSGVNAMVMLNLSAKTRFFVNGEVNYSILRSEALGLENSGFSNTFLLSYQQTLPWDVRMSLAGVMRGKTYTLDGWHGGVNFLTAGLSKTFFDDKLTVGINGVLPVSKSFDLVVESNTASSDYRVNSISTIPVRQALVNLSWTFGSNKGAAVKKSRKSITNDDILDAPSDSNNAGSLMNVQ